jgi:hypothetical protein
MDQIFYINSASFVDVNIESSLHASTGSIIDFSQATQVSGSFVGNLQGNASTATSASYAIQASQANSAISSSYALTASYVSGIPGQIIKAGVVSGSSFNIANGSLTYSVAFVTPFPSMYSITVIGGDARTWVVQNQTLSGFTINSNSRHSLSSLVHWQAIAIGETN